LGTLVISGDHAYLVGAALESEHADPSVERLSFP
jgi:hypothetical protein